jgi:predicted molibdopterin-dependent oxidoreductase YjgC
MLGAERGLIVLADDPPASLGNPASARVALAGLDLLVVLDAFATATSALAHILLAVASAAESEGTYTNLAGFVQPVRAAAPPPSQARPGFLVLAELAGRLGVAGSYASAVDVLAEAARVVPTYASAAGPAGDRPWGATVGAARVEAGPVPPAQASARDEGDGLTLVLSGTCDWGADPLVACSPTLRREHVSRRKLYPRGVLEVSRADAERLGVRQGWAVRVSSAAGEVVLPVSLRADLQPGVVQVPFACREAVAAVVAGWETARVRVARA